MGRAAGAAARGLQMVQQTAAHLCCRPARLGTLSVLHQAVKGCGIFPKFAAMLAPLALQIGALLDCGGLVALAQWLAAHGVEDAAGEP